MPLSKISILIHDEPQDIDGVLSPSVTISNPKVASTLEPLDKNRDGKISPADFDGSDQAMFDKIAMSIGNTSGLSPQQTFGLSDLFKTYKKIHAFDEATTLLSSCESVLNLFWCEREFTADCWNNIVLPAATTGALRMEELSDIAEKLSKLTVRLENRGETNLALDEMYRQCGEYISGFTYVEELIPELARPILSAMAESYNRSSLWYFHSNDPHYSVVEIECEGDGCPDKDEIRIVTIPHLIDVHPSIIRMTMVDSQGCK